MIPAPIPTDEAERLSALRALMLLDTPREERFDRLVRFAAEQLDTPIAMVSLVDGQRQWFKARVGLDDTESARDVSFCGHAILKEVVLFSRTPAAPPALRTTRWWWASPTSGFMPVHRSALPAVTASAPCV